MSVTPTPRPWTVRGAAIWAGDVCLFNGDILPNNVPYAVRCANARLVAEAVELLDRLPLLAAARPRPTGKGGDIP
jgi:hypothetical protein